MAVPHQLLALLLCLWSSSIVCSFNLEPRIPIVKRGSPKSHFGYTVAQHQTILDTVSGRKHKKSWLLVGAPKDQNLQPGTNRSGALWKCPLTTFTTDCEQVKTDGFKDPETGLYDFDYIDESLAEPAEDEIKDDQWLGVTLKSQGPGGKVLVCAHRYMHKGRGFQWGFGLCYILTQNLDLDDYLEPCRGKPVNEGHQQYGFCQAGTSGLLLDDEAVLGVPGPYTWRGTVHTSNISDDFLLKDKTQYFGPVTENDSPVDKYSYLGYSVTAGRFFGNYMSYVGGAPRANETGQVVFFSREKIGESQLRVDLILQGEMFASSYGFEVLGVDINGDRRDDLIVGAPFYYTSSSSGAVYVYMNNDGGFTENHPYTKIEGAAGESRFGFSMTSLGDLNHDGYKDIAIGAPYEGRGAIYIYLGTRNGLMKEPAQVIRAEDMPGIPYDAFGYSLSGGMDLDGNGYPDLLTSSFCSDRVLLIRARPIIDIQTEVRSQNLENIDPTRKGCTEDIGSSETCFSFDACFKMDNEAGTRTGLRLKYIIEEISDRPIVRVHFGDGQKNQPSIIQRDINLRPEDMGSFQCSREIVYLLDGPRNILQPLKFKLSYEIIQREPRPVSEGDPVPDINDYPILNQQEALRYFDGTFAKDCGDDDVCVSDLDVTGRLELQKHETRSHYILRLGEQDTISLHVEVTNTGEAAYQSSLLVTHHQALAFDLRESQTGPHQCSAVSPTQIQCSIGNPLISTTGPLILSFKESGFPFDSKYIQFTAAANSSSTEETPQDPLNFLVEVIKKAEISIIGSVAPEQAFYGGEVVGESAIKHMDQVGMEITHKYVVDNRGPWRVDEMQVEVLWPHQVENNKEQGKWLLYMTEIPTVDGIGECEIDPRYINPLVLRRQPFPETGPFTGLEAEGEVETTNLPGPVDRRPSESEDPADLEAGGSAGAGGVKITKTVTSTKKVTSTTSIKKQTSKTSSAKEVSVATERTSHGYSSSSSSSSSGSSSSSRVSSSGYSDFGSGDEDIDGSGFGQETGRQHGRAHTRVSRRVYSSSHESKFPDGGVGINELGGDLEDEDGNVVSHHEESHSSSRTSPDGSTAVNEYHHESKKVIVKEETQDVPSGRWSEGGGFHRTHYASSGDETINTPERRVQWEEERLAHNSRRKQFQDGIGVDDDTTEGSASYDGSDRSGQNWRVEGGVHRVETVNREEAIRRTYSGDVSRGSYDRYNRTGQDWRGGSSTHRAEGDNLSSSTTITNIGSRNEEDALYRTRVDESSTRSGSRNEDDALHRTRVDGSSARSGSRNDDDALYRTRVDGSSARSDSRNEEDALYRTRVDGSSARSDSRNEEDALYRTRVDESSARREGSRIHYSDHDRRIPDDNRRPYDFEGGNAGIDRYEGGSAGVDRYEGSARTGGRVSSTQNWRVQTGTRRVSTTSGGSVGIDDNYRTGTDNSRSYEGGDFTRTGTDGSGENIGLDNRGQDTQSYRRTYAYGRTSSTDGSGSTRFNEYEKTSAADGSGQAHHDGYERSGSIDASGRTRYDNYDRLGENDGQGTDFAETSRSGESVRRTQSGYERQYGRDRDRAAFDWNDRREEESRRSGGASWTTPSRDFDRSNQDDSLRRTHTSGSAVSSSNVDGTETSRIHASSWRSSGNEDRDSQDSRWASNTNLRTTTFDLNAGQGTHNRASWNSHSGQSGRSFSGEDAKGTHSFKGYDFGSTTPDENGTYTRVEVDPETGETTLYTKRVISRNWQENWDRRPLNIRSESPNPDSPHTRSRRELTRVKREKELIIKPQAVTDAQTGKTMQVVSLKCDGDVPTAKCFVFRCNIRNLGAKQAASIRIKSRLWNSTLVEDYPRVSYVSIRSKASLILPEDIREDQDQSDDVASAETLAYPDLLDKLPPEEVPLWVILVSIFAGLLVLIIIVLILWKLGFFERKRPDPTLSGNLDKDANGY